MTAPALSADRVRVQVGEATLLDDVTLEVAAGELVALVGPNGAGKSTLLHALAGDLPLSGGEVHVAGAPLAASKAGALALRRAVLPQQTVLQFPFTAREVVQMGRSPHVARRGYKAADDDTATETSMRRTQTEAYAARHFPSLSGGERARVSLARVLAQATPIVLLDEPTAALDIRHQEMAMQVAAQLAREGGAVLAVLHDLNLAARYASRVALMAGGRVVRCGLPSEVLQGPLLTCVFEHPIRVVTVPGEGRPLVLPLRACGEDASSEEG